MQGSSELQSHTKFRCIKYYVIDAKFKLEERFWNLILSDIITWIPTCTGCQLHFSYDIINLVVR